MSAPHARTEVESPKTERTFVTVEHYLSTTYRPDCDYVDGEVQRRNLGQHDHSRLQLAIGAYFFNREKKWGIQAVTEQRIQVSPTRFRVPDVCVILGEPDGQIYQKPPFLCIEVLSPKDQMSRVQERIDDFLAMGVAYVWLFDPKKKRAFVATKAAGLCEFKGEILRTENPALELPLAEIFEAD